MSLDRYPPIVLSGKHAGPRYNIVHCQFELVCHTLSRTSLFFHQKNKKRSMATDNLDQLERMRGTQGFISLSERQRGIARKRKEGGYNCGVEACMRHCRKEGNDEWQCRKICWYFLFFVVPAYERHSWVPIANTCRCPYRILSRWTDLYSDHHACISPRLPPWQSP